MKKILSFLSVLALSCASLHAQTNTNNFVVPLGTNVTLSPAVPAVVVTSITVDRLMVDNISQRATIWVHGMAQPIVISGANFAALKTATSPMLSAALVGYLTSQNH